MKPSAHALCIVASISENALQTPKFNANVDRELNQFSKLLLHAPNYYMPATGALFCAHIFAWRTTGQTAFSVKLKLKINSRFFLSLSVSLSGHCGSAADYIHWRLPNNGRSMRCVFFIYVSIGAKMDVYGRTHAYRGTRENWSISSTRRPTGAQEVVNIFRFLISLSCPNVINIRPWCGWLS